MPYGPVAVLGESDFGRFAAITLDNSIRAVVGADTAVSVRRVIQQGNAAQVLIDAADGADLLVVGCRGHGGFAEALLGSISQHCVHHARCPVVIIRGRRA
jgi:nucleotide-binding universal stress UspA family protein